MTDDDDNADATDVNDATPLAERVITRIDGTMWENMTDGQSRDAVTHTQSNRRNGMNDYHYLTDQPNHSQLTRTDSITTQTDQQINKRTA